MTLLKVAFGSNLKLLRKSKGLTQEALAELIGLNQRQLTRIETGVSFLSANVLEKIALALNVNLEELFSFDFERSLDVEDNKRIKAQTKSVEKIFTQVRKISGDQKQLEYLTLAIESLKSGASRRKLMDMIEGMELLQ